MAKQTDQEFLEFVVKSIVDHPDEVKTERVVDEMGVLLSLNVHPEDMAQVIGRQGATARSIRSLLRIVGIKGNARVNLKIEEPEGSTRGKEKPAPNVEDAVGDLE
ncbi:MAG: KH domain-containing protein [Candidatus Spechtbacterales bacterium]